MMSKRQRHEELKAFVHMCFVRLNEDDLKEVCNRAQLSITTVRRLAAGRMTLRTHFDTVLKLGVAAGLRVFFTKTRARWEEIRR